MTKFAMISVLAASLALVACQPAEPETPAETLPQALPIGSGVNVAAPQAVPRDPLQATELGTINGCTFYRVVVDGKPFVLASAYYTNTGTSSAVRTCELGPLS